HRAPPQLGIRQPQARGGTAGAGAVGARTRFRCKRGQTMSLHAHFWNSVLEERLRRQSGANRQTDSAGDAPRRLSGDSPPTRARPLCSPVRIRLFFTERTQAIARRDQAKQDSEMSVAMYPPSSAELGNLLRSLAPGIQDA